MIIEFPEILDYGFFYQFILDRFMHFACSSEDNELIVNIKSTSYIAPSVICDFLCYIHLLIQNESKRIHLMFGNSQHLISYLVDAHFFLCIGGSDKITTDLLYITNVSTDNRKASSTNKICMIRIPDNYPYPSDLPPGRDLQYSDAHQIIRMAYMLYYESKGHRMETIGLGDPKDIAGGYIQILENSYRYACSNIYGLPKYCFYTFQNYKKTGLIFANSDQGDGFYGLFNLRCELIKNNDEINRHILEQPILFSIEEFEELKTNCLLSRLIAMLECITLRISSGANFGYRFIFNKLVIPCDGKMILHSDNVLLEIDKYFLNEFYVIKNGILIDFRRDKLRSIVLNESVRKRLEQKRILRFYNYFFPGVHMCVDIKGGW